jgi:spore coat protein U-like protein
MPVNPHLNLARWLCAVMAAGVAPAAMAQTCTASATAVAFGSYHPQSATALDASGTVTLQCAAHPVALLLGYTIALSAGGSGTFASRHLRAGASVLQYQLYANSTRTTPWGDGSGGTQLVAGGLTLGLLAAASVPHTVYGRIPARQTHAVMGAYLDSIVVTVTY